MTRKLYIVAGAAFILLVNFLFVLWMIAVGLISDWKNGKGKRERW